MLEVLGSHLIRSLKASLWRGIGAYGVFTSYGDFNNITAASFLSEAGKQTPMFTRMFTVIGERGSVDSARDVHGMATRFYADEGNFGEYLPLT
jgi:catalase